MNIFYVLLTVWFNILIGSVFGNDKVTLTTMVTRGPVWPKPTSSLQPFISEKKFKPEENTTTTVATPQDQILPDEKIPSLRRIMVNKNDSLKVDLVSEIRGNEGRRSGGGDNFEWGWDKWCQLQPKIGDCRHERTYYYYQAQTDTCREFTYTGCNGNENRFATKTDCERFCKGFGTVMETRSLTQVEACSLQPDPGNCFSFITRYYYEVNHARCKEFVFGGCGGNANRFTDRQACFQKCDGILLNHQSRRV